MKRVLEKGNVFFQGKFQELERLVIEDGKISEVTIFTNKAKKGKAAALAKRIDEDLAETIDCSGKFILPGFIDPHTHISLEQDGIGHCDSDSNEVFGLITPQIRAYDAVKMRDQAFKDAINGGVTTVMITPGSANPIGGQACIVKTHGKLVSDCCIKESCAMKFAFGENPKRVYGDQKKFPSTRMGTAAVIREWLMKAQDYLKRKKNKEFKERDIKLEALIPLLEGSIPVRAHAHQADDIITAYRIAQEFNLDIVFDHCSEGHLIAKELGKWKAKAVVGPTLIGRTKPEVSHKSFETPKILMDEGCIVALTTDYPVNTIEALNAIAAFAVKYGLSEDMAIKALTENAATILGLDKKLGKIEVGFDADIVVWEGHPLDTRSKPYVVFIDGEKALER